jgi:dolichol kinase
LVLIPMVVLYYYYDLLHLMFLPVLINGIGDGLAEPVGVRFGRHRYQTRALFTGKKYVRSLEGSACVFLTSLIVIVVMRSYFSHEQFVVTLLVVPILMTLTEAISPHTWDTPFIFLVGYLSLFAISFV